MKFSRKTALFILFVVFFVFLDRLLKALCLKSFFDQPVPILGDILSLHYVKNYYIAFSLPFSGPILTALIGLIIIILIIFWLKIAKNFNKNQDISIYPLTILLVGAMLNYADRLRFGFVVDYFDLKWFTIFNIADTMIVVGILLLIVLNSTNLRHKKS